MFEALREMIHDKIRRRIKQWSKWAVKKRKKLKYYRCTYMYCEGQKRASGEGWFPSIIRSFIARMMFICMRIDIYTHIYIYNSVIALLLHWRVPSRVGEPGDYDGDCKPRPRLYSTLILPRIYTSSAFHALSVRNLYSNESHCYDSPHTPTKIKYFVLFRIYTYTRTHKNGLWILLFELLIYYIYIFTLFCSISLETNITFIHPNITYIYTGSLSIFFFFLQTFAYIHG